MLRKIKVCLKHIALAIITAICFVNCEIEDEITPKNTASFEKLNIIGNLVKGDSIFRNNKNIAQFIQARFNDKNTFVNENSTSDTYGFTINTDHIFVLNGENYTNYIFTVTREIATMEGFENYMLTVFDNGNYMQVLIYYPYVSVNGNLEADVTAASLTYINDATLLTGIETSPCNSTSEEILAWEEECVPINCNGGGNHSPGEACHNGEYLAYWYCTGAWVVTGCIYSGSGNDTNTGTSNDPFTTTNNGGSIADPNTTTTPDETVPTIPLEPAWQEVVNCLNGGALGSFDNSLVLSQEDIDWLQSQEGSVHADAIRNYISENGCEESKAFIEEAIDALQEGGEVDFEEKIILDHNFTNNQRLKCIYEKFKSGNNKISNYLNNFLTDNSVAHLNLKTDNDFKTNYAQQYWGAGALTEPPINAVNGSVTANYNIDIIFNTDPSLQASAQNLPTIILATVLIHEMVHAEIFRKLMECAQLPHINFQQYAPSQWRYYINNLRNDFPGLFDYYTRYLYNTQNPSDPQHNLMAAHYRSMIVEALKDFDNNQHSEEFYNQIAWLGLKSTTAWNNLTPAQRTSIDSAITNAMQNETHDCTN